MFAYLFGFFGLCQVPDQRFIRRRKAKRRQFRAAYPPHFLPKQRPRLAPQNASVEEERDRSFRIGVRRLEDERTDIDVGVEFLPHFAPQRVGMALGRIGLAARKLPEASEMDAVRTACDEKRVVLFNDGGDNCDGAQ